MSSFTITAPRDIQLLEETRTGVKIYFRGREKPIHFRGADFERLSRLVLQTQTQAYVEEFQLQALYLGPNAVETSDPVN